MAPGVLCAIWRYPVKSMLGESPAAALVEDRGLAGDRGWAVADVDGRLGSAKTTRRFRRMDGLVEFRARVDGSEVTVTGPDGDSYAGGDPALDSLLSERLGIPVGLRSTDGAEFYDEGPVSMVTTASLSSLASAHRAPVDVRRFRANLVVELDASGYPEDAWVGKEFSVGDVVLRGRNRLQRCVAITLAQEELAEDRRLLRTVAESHGLELALVADVVRPGTVRVGDLVSVG